MAHLSPMLTAWAYLFGSELTGVLPVWQGREQHASQSLFLPRRVASGADEPGGP